MAVVFEDNSIKVKKAIEENCEAFLIEATEEIASRAADNSPVDTGQLKGSWGTKVDGKTGYVGSDVEHSIIRSLAQANTPLRATVAKAVGFTSMMRAKGIGRWARSRNGCCGTPLHH